MEKIIKRLGDRLQSSPKPVVENIVAGIVHEHVQVSERCDRRLEGGLGLHFIGNIQRDSTNFLGVPCPQARQVALDCRLSRPRDLLPQAPPL